MIKLINLKNMLTNSILVRVIWLIIGCIVGAFGMTSIYNWCEENAIEHGRKPMFFRRKWHQDIMPHEDDD